MSDQSPDSRWVVIGVISAVVWLVVFLAPVNYDLSGSSRPGIVSPAMELFVIAWLLIPVALYCDCRYVRKYGDWDVATPLWVGASLIWLLNVITVTAYIVRRHTTVGLSFPSDPREILPRSPAITSRWWYWLAYQPLYLVIYLVGMRGFVGDGAETVPQVVVVIIVLVLSLPVFVLVPLAFYLDARAVSATDLGWTPNPYLYAGLGYAFQNLGWLSGDFGNELLILGMALLAALVVRYLYRRHRYVGTP